MKTRNLKLAITVLLATAAAIAAVLVTRGVLANKFSNFFNPGCSPQQLLCPEMSGLPGGSYPVYLHAGTVAAVISISLTGALLLLALVRRRAALLLAASALSSVLVSVALMYDGVDFIHFGDLATRVLVGTLIGSGAAFIAALAFLVTGMATKRVAGPIMLLAVLVALGATVPWMFARVFVAS